MRLLVCIFIFHLIYFTNGSRQFLFGHRLGGNLIPPEVKPNTKAITQAYFNQTLDHSDPTNPTTWQQRYFVNDESFDTEKRNVAFLFIGGEGEASMTWMTYGSAYENSKKYNALLFLLEHRFYGKSQPFEDSSIEHLKYLSSEQAIDDLATFIVAMNKEYELAPDVKWIVWGGSYAGSVAAWLRQKYPHLVHGASSSSGPLLAIVDFHEYLTVVANDMRTLHSDECANVVQEGFRQLEASLDDPDANIDTLFNLCTPIQDSLNDTNSIGYFLELIADNFAYVAQYNNPTRADTINSICDLLVDKSRGSELQRLADFNNKINGEECVDYTWDSFITAMRNDSLDGEMTKSGMRQWMYQTCTEFAFYQTSTAEPQVFGTKFPIEFFVDLCADSYHSDIDLAYLDRIVDRTNAIYGALNIKVSNVVFSHGTVDPWHVLGVYETVDEAAPAILINGTSHCEDLYGPNPSDSEGLTQARAKITELVGQWLSQ